MAKAPLKLDDVTDKELRKKLEDVINSHHAEAESAPEADAYPRFVFCRSTPTRSAGEYVKVRNCFDTEARGGTIVSGCGRAFKVQMGDSVVIVHDPDDAWE